MIQSKSRIELAEEKAAPRFDWALPNCIPHSGSRASRNSRNCKAILSK
jgi:hypothetical protein